MLFSESSFLVCVERFRRARKRAKEKHRQEKQREDGIVDETKLEAGRIS